MGFFVNGMFFCLVAITVISSMMALDRERNCDDGIPEITTSKHKFFLISIVVSSSLFFLHSALKWFDLGSFDEYYIALLLCGFSITSSSIAIEYTNQCTDGSTTEKNNGTVGVLLAISIVMTLIYLWSVHGAAIKKIAKKPNKGNATPSGVELQSI